MTMKLKPTTLPTRCPVCDDKFSGPQAIKLHNELASATGCRSYRVRREFDGVATRYATPGAQVLDAGSSDTDNTSIFLIGWGVNTCYLIYQ